jgi:hypothetical protein
MTPDLPNGEEPESEHSLPSSDGLVRSLVPEMQARFLGIFSLSYTSIYTIFAWINDRDSVPPLVYFITLIAIWVLFWLSLEFNLQLGSFANRAVDFLWMLGRLLARTSEAAVAIAPDDVAIAPDDVGSLRRPKQVERLSTSRWPRLDSLRVQLLAVGIITMAAWYTLYCGGPFKSPFGSILLALPLLSPNIAAKSGSIAGVFLVTTVDALLFHWWAGPRLNLPSQTWYIATALSVLAISALVSWLVRRTAETAKALTA